MTTTLSPDDGDACGARRILCEQIDEAVEALRGKGVSDDDIHTARKAVKKARATLRLIRGAISRAAYRRENAALRDASRPLSAIRDAKIMPDALDRLAKLYGPAGEKSIPVAFRRALARERNKVQRDTPKAQCARESRDALVECRHRIARLKLNARGWPSLGPDLERVYRSARKAMNDAERHPTTGSLHEWRKQSKYLWHQLQTLSPLSSGAIGELADQAHKLADYLGDDHDLAMLREKIIAHPKSFPGAGGAGALLALIERCQRQLRGKAFVIGRRIYAEKPASFASRHGRYWQKWNRTR
jgi:CHAD domain-containing protein